MVTESPITILKRYEEELDLDENGCGYITLRGLARLCGCSPGTWGKDDRFFTSEIDETLMNLGFEGDRLKTEKGILDVVASIIIKHYAYKGKKQAQNIDMIIGGVGLRTLIQKILGYEQPRRRPIPQRDFIEYVEATRTLTGLDIPAAIKQLLLDKIGDELCEKNLLPPSPRWIGVAQKAQEMGFKVNHSNRCKLGKFVSGLNLPGKKEPRLCNGQMRPIYIYEDTQELENAISKFFNRA